MPFQTRELVTYLGRGVLGACSQPSRPNAPTGLTATPGAGEITLRWQDNSSNETGFALYRQAVASDLGTQAEGNLEMLVTVPANTTQYSDASVHRGMVYRYGVAAEGSGSPSVRSEAETSAQLSNTAPLAKDFSVSAREDVAVQVTLQGSDVDGDALQYRVVGAPLYGSLAGTEPDLTYTPKADFNGIDSFTYVVNDGDVDSPEATVTVRVGSSVDAPEAIAQAVTVNEDGVLPIILTGTDKDSQGLAFTVSSQPQHGSLAGNAPFLVYTPDPNYNGPDMLSFTVSDGTSTSAATVAITVVSVDDAPVLEVDLVRNQLLSYTSATSTFTLTANATDVESGDVSDRVKWTSSLDGDLGDGANIELSFGEHTLTAIVTVDGKTASQSVKVRVGGWTYVGYVGVGTQAQLDALDKVEVITGDLNINVPLDTNLDFAPLAHLRSIGNSLNINGGLTTVAGFDNLEQVQYLYFANNSALTDISGFAKLKQISYLRIYNNPALQDISGFSSLVNVGSSIDIQSNPALVDISGFTALETANTLQFYDNALQNISGFGSLRTLSDSLYLNNNNALQIVSGFAKLETIGNTLYVTNNAALTNLFSLSRITGVGNSLIIQYNNMLTEVSGFDGLTKTNQIIIYGNSVLTRIDGFGNLASVTYSLDINNNPSLTTISGFGSLISQKVSSNIIDNTALDCLAQTLAFAPVNQSSGNLVNCALK